MSKTVEELQAELQSHPTIMRGLGRFEAKLTFDERCSVLALYMSGVHRRVLALAFGVDRRTVAHIYNKNSIHYKNVRAELDKLGRDVFLTRHLTEDATRRVAEVANHPSVTLSDDFLREVKDEATVPDKRRNRKAGVNVVKPEQCDYSHRVVIEWRENGWYYQDMDGNDPNAWLHSGPESLLSSANALKGAEQEIIDRL
jgi:hypothetical protein